MKDIKKILCPIDLSEDCVLLAEYSSTLGKALGAEVYVLYVAPTLSQYVGFHVPPSSIENFVGEIVDDAIKNMDKFIAENFTGIKASGKVLTGYAAEEILHYATEMDVDMIIMATHGRKGLDRFLFGSVAEKIVKNAHQAVLTIHPDE